MMPSFSPLWRESSRAHVEALGQSAGRGSVLTDGAQAVFFLWASQAPPPLWVREGGSLASGGDSSGVGALTLL